MTKHKTEKRNPKNRENTCPSTKACQNS